MEAVIGAIPHAFEKDAASFDKDDIKPDQVIVTLKERVFVLKHIFTEKK